MAPVRHRARRPPARRPLALAGRRARRVLGEPVRGRARGRRRRDHPRQHARGGGRRSSRRPLRPLPRRALRHDSRRARAGDAGRLPEHHPECDDRHDQRMARREGLRRRRRARVVELVGRGRAGRAAGDAARVRGARAAAAVVVAAASARSLPGAGRAVRGRRADLRGRPLQPDRAARLLRLPPAPLGGPPLRPAGRRRRDVRAGGHGDPGHVGGLRPVRGVHASGEPARAADVHGERGADRPRARRHEHGARPRDGGSQAARVAARGCGPTGRGRDARRRHRPRDQQPARLRDHEPRRRAEVAEEQERDAGGAPELRELRELSAPRRRERIASVASSAT